jgi:shikimate kinase
MAYSDPSFPEQSLSRFPLEFHALPEVFTRFLADAASYAADRREHGLPVLTDAFERTLTESYHGALHDNPRADLLAPVLDAAILAMRRSAARSLVPGNIALVGFMGTGKSTVSAVLNSRLGMACYECDTLIEQKAGMSINEIFARFGEPYFRDLETEILSGFADEKQAVISCGGGAVLRRKNVDILRSHSRIVLLTASPETILFRLRDDDSRPKLRGRKTPEGIRALMDERDAAYRAAADITVATDGKSAVEICNEILAALGK